MNPKRRGDREFALQRACSPDLRALNLYAERDLQATLKMATDVAIDTSMVNHSLV